MATPEIDQLTDQAKELSLHEDSSITINYDDRKDAQVPEIKMLTKLLIDEKLAVVFFGESDNFTFSVGFATLRGSWNNITVTRYVLPEAEPDFSDMKLQTIDWCIRNGKQLGDKSTEILRKIKAVLSLPSGSLNWKIDAIVDATKIPASLDVRGKVVWFQCPWAKHEHGIGALIEEFLQHMASKQSANNYVLIGIANFFPYVKEYKLQNLLGNKLQGPTESGYKFCGADRTLVKEILRYGYKHQGIIKDIHAQIFHHHVTLVFQKK